MVTVVDSPALSLSPSLPPASSSICVECSLRDDCLRTFRFCKHSKSPIFNRSMRTLNRFPIYLGEDMCDRINREALLKDILIFDKNKLNSIEYEIKYRYEGGKYSCYRIMTYHWICKRHYPTGYCWLQRDNSLDAMNGYGEKASRHIERYYDDTEEAKKKFKNWVQSITHKRIIARFNLNMNKMYGEDTIERRRYFPIWNQVNYWAKIEFDNYNPLRRKHYLMRELIHRRKKYVCNGLKVKKCSKIANDYLYEVDTTRINQLKRYLRLMTSTKDKMEKYWYLMKMGMLCYSNKETTNLKQSKDYIYLGTYHSHTRYVNDGRFPNSDNDWDSDDNHFWSSQRQNHYDLRQRIYVVTHYYSPLINYDIYCNDDTYNFSQLIKTNIELPKINTLRWQRKKCMNQLIKTSRRIRSDCGRSRGPNIRTTNPHYCIFTLYPEVDIGLIYHFPEL